MRSSRRFRGFRTNLSASPSTSYAPPASSLRHRSVQVHAKGFPRLVDGRSKVEKGGQGLPTETGSAQRHQHQHHLHLITDRCSGLTLKHGRLACILRLLDVKLGLLSLSSSPPILLRRPPPCSSSSFLSLLSCESIQTEKGSLRSPVGVLLLVPKSRRSEVSLSSSLPPPFAFAVSTPARPPSLLPRETCKESRLTLPAPLTSPPAL
jgi:hypothetical protein